MPLHRPRVTRGGALRALALAGGPGLLAAVCWLFGRLCPGDAVWGSALQAGLLSLPAWLLLIWPLWGVGAALATRRPALPLAGAILGVAVAGRPLPAAEGGAGYAVLAANVNAFTGEPAELERAIADLAPDVAIVIERRAESIPGMVRIADDFADPMPRPSHATAVFCREGLACEAWVSPQIGSPTMAMPVALTRLPGEKALCIVGIHAPPPAPFDASGMMPYVEHVAARLEAGRIAGNWGPCRAGDSAAVVGDLNMVPGSPPYRALLARGLADAWRGRDPFAATWPAGGDWPNLPFFRLDQVLVGAASVEGLLLVRLPRTDHKASLGWYRAL